MQFSSINAILALATAARALPHGEASFSPQAVGLLDFDEQSCFGSGRTCTGCIKSGSCAADIWDDCSRAESAIGNEATFLITYDTNTTVACVGHCLVQLRGHRQLGEKGYDVKGADIATAVSQIRLDGCRNCGYEPLPNHGHVWVNTEYVNSCGP